MLTELAALLASKPSAPDHCRTESATRARAERAVPQLRRGRQRKQNPCRRMSWSTRLERAMPSPEAQAPRVERVAQSSAEVQSARAE